MRCQNVMKEFMTLLESWNLEYFHISSISISHCLVTKDEDDIFLLIVRFLLLSQPIKISSWCVDACALLSLVVFTFFNCVLWTRTTIVMPKLAWSAYHIFLVLLHGHIVCSMTWGTSYMWFDPSLLQLGGCNLNDNHYNLQNVAGHISMLRMLCYETLRSTDVSFCKSSCTHHPPKKISTWLTLINICVMVGWDYLSTKEF